MIKIAKTLLTLTLLSSCLIGCTVLNKETESGSARTKGTSKQKSQSLISAGSEQLALMYNPYSTTIHPKVFVKKKSDNDMDLFVEINDSELLFSKANAKNSNIANVRIYYKIMESYENITLIDSCQKIITFTKSENPRTYNIKLKVKPVELEKFVIMTTVSDLNRGKMSIHFTDVDRTNSLSADNFMITRMDNLQPYTNNYIKKGEAVRIDYLRGSTNPVTYGGDHDLIDIVPVLPYGSNPAIEDTVIFSNTGYRDKSYILKGEDEKIYITTADTAYKQNLAIPCFGGDFPNINTPDELIKPLAYLMKPEEYEKLKSSKTKKLDVDEFWYSCSQDLRKAKEQIKIYYTRAIFANLYFTDYREGSMTDRGMLYIVFGPPKILAITSKSEIWTYVDKQNGKKISYVFARKENKLCGVEYVLRRYPDFKYHWDRGVNAWRKGKIFSF
ncbi:MAG: GWxTD domain-containing protein [Bacteroidales bacterium]|nr:GWxTD domain-containing protein [Bacteroidales bacterium]